MIFFSLFYFAGDVNIVTNKEYIFSLFLILNGSLYYAFLISAITSLLSNKDVATKMFRADVASIHMFLQLRDVPEGLRLRIDQLMQFSLTQQCGCNESIFLKDIPKPLLREIKHTYINQLQQLPFFAGLSSRFIELCVERLVYRTYVPGSVVYFQNERRREVLLIKTGKIELKVHSAQGALFTCMAGDSIGDFQLIFGNPSEVTAQASTFTEVMVLSLEAFTEAVQAHNLGSSISVDQWLAEQSTALQATIDSHRRHLVKFVKTRMTIEVTRKNKRMLDMMADIHTARVAWIILPDAIFRPVWAAFSLLGMVYFTFAIPMRVLAYLQCPAASMHKCLSLWDYSLVIDYMWDVFFVVDLVLHCFFFAFKSYENDQHTVVTDRREICRRFWRTPVAYLHVLAVMPIDLLSLRWGYLLCMRLSKLLWVSLMFDRISLILYYFEHDSASKKALLSTEGITVIHLAIITFLVMLWTAVGWAMLRLETDGTGFVGSFYWTMTTMTTVGFGDITPETNIETLFTVMFCIVGPSCSATIIANAASFFNSTDVSVDNVSHRQLVVKTFLSTVIPEVEIPGRRKSSVMRMEKKTAISAMSVSNTSAGRRRSSGRSHCQVHPVESVLDVVNEDNSSPVLTAGGLPKRRNSGALVPSQFPKSPSVSGLPSFRKKSEDCSPATKHAHVLSYLEYVGRERCGLDENKLLRSLLPDYMQESLQQASVMSVVLSSNFYSKCNSGFLRDVMLVSDIMRLNLCKLMICYCMGLSLSTFQRMEVRFVPQNSMILNAGSAVSASYMILSGKIECRQVYQ